LSLIGLTHQAKVFYRIEELDALTEPSLFSMELDILLMFSPVMHYLV